MCATIARIENAGPGLRARRLVFSDGSPTRTTSAAALKETGIQEGTEITPEALESELATIEPPLAKDRALRLLGYREHSSAELEHKLRDSGYPKPVAASIVARFVEVELVDDARFAGAWIRTRHCAGYGARRIRQELERKGVAPETIDAAFEESATDGVDEFARASAALGSRQAHDRASRDKLVRRLIGRGFSLTVAIGAVDASRMGSDEVDTPSDLP